MDAGTLSASEAVRLVRDRGADFLIDVRTPAEVAAERVDGARPIPLDELRSRVDEVRAVGGRGGLLCRTGRRAERARRILLELGLGPFAVVGGGIRAYAAAGGATTKGEPGVSLERQVRIAAGALVLLGIVLGWLVHPALHGVAAFAGAGLVFAGVTDFCGMGLLLARMPWNRVSD